METSPSSQIKTTAGGNLDNSRLTSLVNSMIDGVIAVDKNVDIVLFNSAALNILDRNNLKEGDSLANVLKPIDKNSQPVDIIKLISSTVTPTTNRDLRITYTDGSTSNLYLSIAPVHLGYGRSGLEGFVLLIRDITYEKSLEEERDEFISVVSHELRTPVTIAEGNISNAQLIMSKGSSIELIEKALAEAHNQVLYLADMINDLSTLSRAERGILTLDIEPINIHELIDELIKDYAAESQKKNLYFKSILDPKLEVLQSSKLYVKEILQNFITNALKYTNTGGVTITANQKEKGVEINIADTGIGISKADQERVFDKFFRSEDYRTRQTNGTGLGLYVTMKLTRLTNSVIHFSSELNHGSTFTVYFPNLDPNQTPKTDS